MQEKDIVKKIKGKFTKDNFLILVLVGVLLLVIAWPMEEKNGKNGTQSVQWDSETDMLNIRSKSSSGQGQETGTGFSEDALLSYASALESSLEELLGTMAGVGKVKVMVTLKDFGEALVEKDTSMIRNSTAEADSAGGTRNTTNNSDARETVYWDSGTPYVKQVLSPRVEGVVVSAQGGGNAQIIRNITEAIQALFGIEAHKIKIVKMISQ